DRFHVKAGATVDFDFLAISSVPIGVLLGGRFSTVQIEDDSDEVYGGLIRIAYNGRSDFIIGLDIGFDLADSKSLDQTLNLGSVGINLRYYF
ncbi:MAG: hypothetical protein AMS21_10420, partial [Gemmatimonas sp. SG8_38_2]